MKGRTGIQVNPKFNNTRPYRAFLSTCRSCGSNGKILRKLNPKKVIMYVSNQSRKTISFFYVFKKKDVTCVGI